MATPEAIISQREWMQNEPEWMQFGIKQSN